MDEKGYTWYIEPLTDITNNAIQQYLSEAGLELSSALLLCADGKKHNLWECPIDLVKLIFSSKNSLSLRFVIWGKKDRYGKITNKGFLFKPKNKYLKKKKTAAH